MTTEADTCRKFVVPKLQAAGWDADPHSIAEQRYFTDGRIIVRGNRVRDDYGKLWFNILDYTAECVRTLSPAPGNCASVGPIPTLASK